MKKLIIVITSLYSSIFFSQKTIDDKVNELLQQMTIEEKAGQLAQLNSDWENLTGPILSKSNEDKVAMIRNGSLGSILNVRSVEQTRMLQEHAMQSRLKIPLLFAQDVIHGFRTTFPINLGQAATWDLEMIEKSERIAAIEASAYGLHWTFAPMVDVSRDARWGRVMEGSGEDTFLGSEIAKARVRGFQGKGLGNIDALMACAKHFAAYGASVGGRDYNSVDMSLRQLYEVYLPPFLAAKNEGVATFMNAFNDINGIPSSAHHLILREILKKDWNFKGFVVSDWGSIGEMIPHGYAEDGKDAALKAIIAGTDMDMESRVYAHYIPDLVREGKLDVKIVDDAVKRILYKKFELGLFDDPFKFMDVKRQKEQENNKEHREFGRKFGAKSIVLLKNTKNILPLSKKTKTVALIGPFGKESIAMHGFWSVPFKDDANRIVTQYEGIKSMIDPSSILLYAKGSNVDDNDKSMFAEAIETAKKADVIIMTLGEGHAMSGEAKSRSNIGFSGVQEELLKEIHKIGKPIILMINAGRPLVFDWASENIDTIVYTWWLGTEAGNSIADVLFGNTNPSAKITMSFPRSVGQVPIYYNHYNTGRPALDSKQRNYVSAYIDLDNDPKYPFGYGLSYTKFDYSDFTINKTNLSENDKLEISIKIKNSGNYDGEEIVQLYVRDIVGKVVRPVKELKGFKKIKLNKGESKIINFTLSTDDLKFFDDELNFDWEPGNYDIMIGPNSRDVMTKRINWNK